MNEENRQVTTSDRLNANSRFWRILLVILAALLAFAGPTYVVYVLLNAVHMRYSVSMGLGIVLFAAGLMLVWFLIRKKVIS